MKFKNYIETESGIKDTSNSPGTAGQLLSSTVTGTSWIDQNTISSGSSEVVDIQVKNISSANGGVNLSKGDPVYIYGSVGASPRLYVDLADADSTAINNLGDNKMPCVGLLDQDLAPNGEGTATVVGKLRNLITSPIDGDIPSENDTVYVKPGGGLTLTKPAGSANLIQNVGQVGRVSTSSDGNIVVAALLRSNDVPNLPTGRLFVGTATNTSLVSDVVYVDDANDRVGIGTNTPSYQLQVTGNSSDSPLFQVDDSGDPYLQIKPDSNTFFKIGDIGGLGNEAFIEGSYYDLKFNVVGNTTMTLEGNNRVGIGTTSPDSKLEVASTDDITYLHVRNDSTGSTRLKMSNLTDTNSNGFQIINNGLNGQVNLVNYKATTLALWTSSIQRMTILSGGNVGIGTTNPTQKLHINGNARLTGQFYDGTNSSGTNGQILSSDGGQTEWIDGSAIPGVPAGSGTVNYLARWTPDNDTLGIGVTYDNGTNVGIGTTNPPDKLSISGGTLSVSGSGSGFGVVKLGDPTVSTPYVGVYRSAAAAIATSGNFLNLGGYDGIAFTTGAAQLSGQPERMRITNTGNVGIGTTNPQEKLHVQNYTAGESHQAMFKGGAVAVGDYSYISLNNGYSTEYNKEVRLAAVSEQSNSNKTGFAILTSPDGSGASGHERLRVTADGSVGIGTTSPSDRLEVAAANSQLRLRDTDDNNFAQFSYSSGKLVVRNNSTTTTVNQFTLDSIGRIGIGTTSPAEKLHIKSTASSSSSMLYLENAAWAGNMTTGIAFKNGANYLGHTAKIYTIMNGSGNQGGEIRFATLDYSGTNPNPNTTLVDRMTIDDNGNVGIGTSSPDYLFEVEKFTSGGVFTTVANFKAGTDADNTGAQINVGISNRGWFVKAGRDVGNVAIASMGLNESYGTYNYMTFKSGNVGILTTSPQARLHVANGTLRTWTPSIGTSAIFESTASNRNFLTITATNESEIWFGDATTQAKGRVRYENNNNTMELWTNGSPRININSTGNVGIGTTSPTGAKLQVAVANYSTGCRIDGPAGTTFGFMSFYSGGSYRGNIQPTSSGVIYSSASDYRLKENVVKLQNSTERVKKLKPSNFNFLENPGEIVDGFLAHEIQEVVPEAVTGKKDEVGVDGKPIYQGVDYSKIVPLLTAALQEAISKIEQLETRIQTLENK